MDNLKNEVEKIFEQNGIVIEQNGNLSDLDSLKLVSSIVDIEDKFNIEFPDELLLMDVFIDINSVCQIIQKIKEDKEKSNRLN